MTERPPEWWWARQAAAQFDLVGRVRQVASGMDSTFALTTPSGVRWAIRVGLSPVRTREAFVAETRWIERLGDNPHLRVPPVRSTDSGDHVVEVTGAGQRRHAVALRWIGGRKARARFGAGQARRLGSALAALHLDARSNDDDPAMVKDWRTRLCGIGSLDQLEVVAGRRARQVAEELERLVEEACADLEPGAWGLVNRDVGPHNTVWDRADPRPGLFDFDDSGWGPFASDLARYLHALRWRANGCALVAEALEGYQEVAELPEGWDVHSTLFGAACDLFAARYYAPQVGRGGTHAKDLVDQMMRRVASWVAERS